MVINLVNDVVSLTFLLLFSLALLGIGSICHLLRPSGAILCLGEDPAGRGNHSGSLDNIHAVCAMLTVVLGHTITSQVPESQGKERVAPACKCTVHTSDAH